MSLRISLLHLRKINLKNKYLSRPLTSCLIKHSQSSNLISAEVATSDKNETIHFPKNVQPFVNQSVEAMFSKLNFNSMSVTESVSVLKALRMFTLFKNMNPNDFKDDQRFKTLCSLFEKNCNTLQPSSLISGLRSLLEVGLSPNSDCVIAAEENIVKNISLFSTFNLIGCLYYHHKFTETDLQKKVVLELTNELCKRSSDIALRAEILMLPHILHIFGENDRRKLEQKIVELAIELNAHDICKVFNALAENSNRSVNILNTLTFQLRQKKDILQLKEILDLLYSFKKLNFFDTQLIIDLMQQIMGDLPSVKQPSIISGVLTTCGYLRLRHIGVLNTCAEWIMNNVDICRPKEFISLILTTASLNFFSDEIKKTVHEILPLITFEKVKSSDVWLDYVWSLTILNIVDKKMLLKVLDPSFYKPLIDNSGFQADTNKLKLMNLKTVLKIYYPEFIFGCNLYLDPFEIPQSTEIQNSRQHVLKILSNFVPRDKYLCTNQSTDMGIFIDAEFIMDKNLKPLPIKEYGILSKVTNTKTLPAGAQRIALMVLFYKDFTLCTASRIGLIDLAIKLLFSQGYTAVPISFDEFLRNNTEVKKTKYLLQKITTTMKKVENNNYKFNIKLFN